MERGAYALPLIALKEGMKGGPRPSPPTAALPAAPEPFPPTEPTAEPTEHRRGWGWGRLLLWSWLLSRLW